MRARLLTLIAAGHGLAGCTAIAERTNSLSDERVLAETAGVLGYSPSQLQLVARRTSGTNTYAELRTDNARSSTASSMAATWPPSAPSIQLREEGRDTQERTWAVMIRGAR